MDVGDHEPYNPPPPLGVVSLLLLGVERGRGFGDVLVSLSRQPAKICVVVKIMAPFVGTQNIRCRIIIRTQNLTGPKPKEIEVETFRIDYLVRTPKVEKLSLQPIGNNFDNHPYC